MTAQKSGTPKKHPDTAAHSYIPEEASTGTQNDNRRSFLGIRLGHSGLFARVQREPAAVTLTPFEAALFLPTRGQRVISGEQLVEKVKLLNSEQAEHVVDYHLMAEVEVDGPAYAGARSKSPISEFVVLGCDGNRVSDQPLGDAEQVAEDVLAFLVDRCCEECPDNAAWLTVNKADIVATAAMRPGIAQRHAAILINEIGIAIQRCRSLAAKAALEVLERTLSDFTDDVPLIVPMSAEAGERQMFSVIFQQNLFWKSRRSRIIRLPIQSPGLWAYQQLEITSPSGTVWVDPVVKIRFTGEQVEHVTTATEGILVPVLGQRGGTNRFIARGASAPQGTHACFEAGIALHPDHWLRRNAFVMSVSLFALLAAALFTHEVMGQPIASNVGSGSGFALAALFVLFAAKRLPHPLEEFAATPIQAIIWGCLAICVLGAISEAVRLPSGVLQFSVGLHWPIMRIGYRSLEALAFLALDGIALRKVVKCGRLKRRGVVA